MADMTTTKAPFRKLPTSLSDSMEDLRIVGDPVAYQRSSFPGIGGLVKQLLACRRDLETTSD